MTCWLQHASDGSLKHNCLILGQSGDIIFTVLILVLRAVVLILVEVLMITISVHSCPHCLGLTVSFTRDSLSLTAVWCAAILSRDSPSFILFSLFILVTSVIYCLLLTRNRWNMNFLCHFVQIRPWCIPLGWLYDLDLRPSALAVVLHHHCLCQSQFCWDFLHASTKFEVCMAFYMEVMAHLLSEHYSALKGHSGADWPICFSRSIKSLIYNIFTYKVWTLNFYRKGSEIWSFILMLGNSKLCR